MIFAMYKDGFSIGRIAARLNQMGVLSPMEYKHSAGVKFDTVFKTGDTAKWTYKAVQRILTNEVYIGVLAQGKRGTPNYKVGCPWHRYSGRKCPLCPDGSGTA